ncbi:hypothetical protein, partial [Photobacterium phosphoreum]|uniref:hypothetical protein n=1 Tax=Photobacterium phosphoreum TaxID=659 RepID=UPI001961D1F7
DVYKRQQVHCLELPMKKLLIRKSMSTSYLPHHYNNSQFKVFDENIKRHQKIFYIHTYKTLPMLIY